MARVSFLFSREVKRRLRKHWKLFQSTGLAFTKGRCILRKYKQRKWKHLRWLHRKYTSDLRELQTSIAVVTILFVK